MKGLKGLKGTKGTKGAWWTSMRGWDRVGSSGERRRGEEPEVVAVLARHGCVDLGVRGEVAGECRVDRVSAMALAELVEGLANPVQVPALVAKDAAQRRADDGMQRRRIE